MTDPTPAKGATAEGLGLLIQEAREMADDYGMDGLKSGLQSRSMSVANMLTRLIKSLDAGSKRLDLAEQTIRDAPHGAGCNARGVWSSGTCDCWKARYDATKEALT